MSKQLVSNDYDLAAIFTDMVPTDILVKDTKFESDYYNPDPKFSKNGKNYISRIKFLPFIQNPKLSILSKWVVYLQNPNGTKRYVDCPSTVNKPSVLQQIYFALKKSENSAEEKLAENFSRRRVYFSLVKILDDPNKPELVGKIKVFKYGQKLYSKLDKLMNPEPTSKRQPHNPFDIFNGRPFDFDVKIVAGYNNYDDCEFSINPESFEIEGEVIANAPKNYAKVANWVADNSPDILRNQFKDWDDETTLFVIDTIEQLVPNTRLVSEILRKNNFNINYNPQTPLIKKTLRKNDGIDVNVDDDDSPFKEDPIISKRQNTFNEMKDKIKPSIDDDDEELDEIESIMADKITEKPKQKIKSKTITEDDDDLYAGL